MISYDKHGLFYFCKSVFMFMLNMNHFVIIDEVFHFIFFDGSDRFTSLAGLFCTIIKPFSRFIMLFYNRLNTAIDA